MRPEIGNVIDASVNADIGEHWLELACQAVLDKGNIPRAVIVSPYKYKSFNDWAKEQEPPEQELADMARKFGLVVTIDREYAEDEWAVTDLVQADANIYWNPGPFA